jgi:hypothetical protein
LSTSSCETSGLTSGEHLESSSPSIATPTLTTIQEVPSYIIISSGFNNLRLDEALTFYSAMGETHLRLRGLIYHSPGAVMGQFTSVLLDRHGSMWYHDGIMTGHFCTQNGKYQTCKIFSLYKQAEHHRKYYVQPCMLRICRTISQPSVEKKNNPFWTRTACKALATCQVQSLSTSCTSL